MLQENKKLFDETLNVYPHKKVQINIDPNAKPVHLLPHPVPPIHLKTFKRKDNRVRWISNSRQLNRVIRCKQYPLPTITDILRKCSGFKFFTKLDIGMQYYTFELIIWKQMWGETRGRCEGLPIEFFLARNE